MSKTNLNTLAAKLAAKSGITQTEAELFIRKMFDVCNQGLEADKQVKMRWLGTFKVTTVKDRESVDVNTGERILIEGRDKISFTPDNILKEIVNKPFAQFETVVVNDGVDFDSIDEKYQMSEEESQSPVPSFDLESSAHAESASQMPASQTLASQMSDSQMHAFQKPAFSDEPEKKVEKSGEVIDFLDTPQDDSPSEEVIVVGNNGSVETFVSKPEQEKETESVKVSETETEKENVKESETGVEIKTETSETETSETETEAGSDDRSELVGEKDSVDENDSAIKSESMTKAEPAPVVNEKPAPEPTVTDMSVGDKESSAAAVSVADDEPSVNDEPVRSGHFVIPKYAVIAACIAFLAMMGGVGWMAFNYGQMAAQRNHLALQLDQYKAEKSAAQKAASDKSMADAQEQRLKQKAYEGSVRMAQASDAIKVAETAAKKDSIAKAKADAAKAAELAKLEAAKNEKAKNEAKKEQQKNEKANAENIKASSKYDSDPRVRTGAYRIVGVAQTITVSAGQTMSAISNRYLGPGMECYIEALNGTTTVKSGQKLKIPKLELKKRK